MSAVAYDGRLGSVRSVLHDYWFRPGGIYAIAICRVFLFLGVLYAYHNGGSLIVNAASVADYYASVSLAAYTPKGIVRLLFPDAPPPAIVVDWAIFFGKWATLAAIVGLFTRASMVLSVLSVLFIISLHESWRAYWSHGYNIILLAGLAFMFGRAGDTLSVDALIRRWRGKSSAVKRHDGSYWWPVLLAQFAVALVYFGGFYAKWSGPEWTFNLDWILSDNLRNSLALPWNQRGMEMPWYIALVASNPILWQLVAAGHFANQLLPMLACFSTRKPWARLVEGLIFAVGVVMLGVFMTLWNNSWLLMVAFFVDWDYFIRWGAEKVGIAKERVALWFQSAGEVQVSRCARAAIATFITVFLGFYGATLLFKLGSTHLMYPFSSMAFYSDVKALKPYDRHSHYPYYGGQVSAVIDGEEMPLWVHTGLSGYFRAVQSSRTIVDRTSAIEAIANHLNTRGMVSWERERLREDADEYRLYATVFHLPAFPAPPTRVVAHRGLVAVSAAGRTLAADGAYSWNASHSYIDVETLGFRNPQISILGRPNPRANGEIVEAVEIAGRWDGRRFYVTEDISEPLFTLIRVSDSGKTYDFYGPEFVR